MTGQRRMRALARAFPTILRFARRLHAHVSGMARMAGRPHRRTPIMLLFSGSFATSIAVGGTLVALWLRY